MTLVPLNRFTSTSNHVLFLSHYSEIVENGILGTGQAQEGGELRFFDFISFFSNESTKLFYYWIK